MSCDDKATEPTLSIVDEINNTRPFDLILVYNADSGNWRFGKNPNTDNPFTDAYAENGYFVVTTSVSTYYFNLSLAKQVYIYQKDIKIYY